MIPLLSGKVAISNRGEVAVRIIRACQELGVPCVLFHSEADIKTRAYRLADETYCLGESASSESYLNLEKNLRALKETGANFLHPGFGFLSENGEFAQKVEDMGVTFIGPRSETIFELGDKVSAKELIKKAKIPTVPGYQGEDQSLKALCSEAEKIGYPVIVKAAAGGGGRGMKIIRSQGDAKDLIESAQREAESAFGSSKVFLEKYLDRAKHIEFQIFGDGKGGAVHLGERECSVQRRHQKIIEEAPSPSVSDDLRGEMGAAAVQLASLSKYRGAGTVEFLLQDGKYYFLEVNTRLQVEHPVTEIIYGVDLVKAQILLAAGRFTLWKQEELVPRGHALECRIYAEDSYQGGVPSTGILGSVVWPDGPGRRFDYGFERGDEITPNYDSMIAKVIVWDEDRHRSLFKMERSLRDCVVFGVKTNFSYLCEILTHKEFVEGSFTTQFIEKSLTPDLAIPELSESDLSALRDVYQEVSEGSANSVSSGDNIKKHNIWSQSWRLT